MSNRTNFFIKNKSKPGFQVSSFKPLVIHIDDNFRLITFQLKETKWPFSINFQWIYHHSINTWFKFILRSIPIFLFLSSIFTTYLDYFKIKPIIDLYLEVISFFENFLNLIEKFHWRLLIFNWILSTNYLFSYRLSFLISLQPLLSPFKPLLIQSAICMKGP